MTSYYAEKLSGRRLEQCYDLAPPRIRQYLRAEIEHAVSRFSDGAEVLELGCGYGRLFPDLLEKAGLIVGVDNSLDSLSYARAYLSGRSGYSLVCSEAARLALADRSFDCVLCLQNGLSAFHSDPKVVVAQALRATRPGGIVLCSSYSPRIWEARLNWFEKQAEAGLLGEIDFERTGNGEIVCKDGFTATTFSEDAFRRLAAECGLEATVQEVDHSSIFCEFLSK
jgi:2-polyprenyl-6-hydroxyphenyl methylase/3-demethylubiquinone-9 3-methyltransferase